jgi:glycosyltransferase involved in cell wall biosynthesis
MSKVSVIIPSRNERFLAPTVADVLSKAAGEIEVITTLDGYWPTPQLADDKRLIQIHRGKARGMRPGINAAAAVARGRYLMKMDAHCAIQEGFDEILKRDCEDNWVVVPRRFSLDAENWRPQKRPHDYQYLSYPDNEGDRGGPGLHGRDWEEKNRDPVLAKKKIDDLMSAQGSCWFMRTDYFHEMELLDEASYGTFGSEFQEVGLKCWLGGGRVVRNKGVWYAHLHKGKKYGRGWPLGKTDANQATKHTNRWVHDDAWPGGKQTRPFKWLIHHFWPVPGWPQEWAP